MKNKHQLNFLRKKIENYFSNYFFTSFTPHKAIMPEQTKSRTSYINKRKVINDDHISRYGINQIARFMIAEMKIIQTNDEYKEYAYQRILVMMGILSSRFRFVIIQNSGIMNGRYAVAEEDIIKIRNEVDTSVELYKVDNFISTRHYTIRNVGNSVATYNPKSKYLTEKEEELGTFDLEINKEIIVCDRVTVQISNVRNMSSVDDSYVNSMLRYYCVNN